MTNANANHNADSAIDLSRTLIPSSYSLLGHDLHSQGGMFTMSHRGRDVAH